MGGLWDPTGLGTSWVMKPAGRVRRPEKEAAPVDEGPEMVPQEEAEKKDKVVLKNPKWEAADVGFNEETDISVEAELPPSQAHKTKVAFELFAKTPGGPERISQADGQIKDGKALAKIPVYIPQYRDAEGNLLSEVDYKFTAKHSASDLLDDDKAIRHVDHMANLVIDCHIVADVTFATGKSQVRPSQVPALKALVDRIAKWKQEHPDGKIAVFGHADAEGKEEPNKKLSEKRAKALHAFLMKDGSVWDALAKEEKWNKQEDFDHQAFMDEHNTLKLAEKDFDAIDGAAHMGCSEYNLVEKTDKANERNRRVSVFLLKSNKNFPIQYPCKHGDIGPCKAQVKAKGERRTAGFACRFYDKLLLEQAAGASFGEALDFTDFPDAWLPHPVAARITARAGAEELAAAERTGEDPHPIVVSTSESQAIRYWHHSGGPAWTAEEYIDEAVAEDDEADEAADRDEGEDDA
jgi:outer membrane protein OmpA-like peptidoglycan-associated protein